MNIFSVDVEDGISIAMRDAFNKNIPQTYRVVKNTLKILDILDEKNHKGTFFVLGQVAEVFPNLIREIDNRGHEVGIHGYDHWQFFKLTPKKAFNEISRAKKVVEDLLGNKVYGHRAPAFSITPQTKWGLDVVAEAGFVYDSSIMPCKVNRYGWPEFSKEIVSIETQKGNSIIEVPLSVDRFLGRNVPVCGGGYLRLFPHFVTKNSFNRIAAKRPVNVYIHPYELDTDKYPDYYFDELRNCSLKKRLSMQSFWVNRSTVQGKIESLLQNHKFDLLINIVNSKKNQLKKIHV